MSQENMKMSEMPDIFQDSLYGLATINVKPHTLVDSEKNGSEWL
jgi:hypothetical protein